MQQDPRLAPAEFVILLFRLHDASKSVAAGWASERTLLAFRKVLLDRVARLKSHWVKFRPAGVGPMDWDG